MNITPSIRGVEADVEEIKLKETPIRNNRHRTSSFAKALKKRISLTRLTKDRENKEKESIAYPTFTIEDWEETERSFADSVKDDYKDSFSFKDDYKDTLSFKDEYAISEDDKTDVEDNDINIFDDDKKEEETKENSDFSDVMSETSEHNAMEHASQRSGSRLTVEDQSMIIGTRARFYKRLSICDLKVSYQFLVLVEANSTEAVHLCLKGKRVSNCSSSSSSKFLKNVFL